MGSGPCWNTIKKRTVNPDGSRRPDADLRRVRAEVAREVIAYERGMNETLRPAPALDDEALVPLRYRSKSGITLAGRDYSRDKS